MVNDALPRLVTPIDTVTGTSIPIGRLYSISSLATTMPSVSRCTPCRAASENSQSIRASSSNVTVLALLTCRNASRSDHRTRTWVTLRRLIADSPTRSNRLPARAVCRNGSADHRPDLPGCYGQLGQVGDGHPADLAECAPGPGQPGLVLLLPLLDLGRRVLVRGCG